LKIHFLTALQLLAMKLCFHTVTGKEVLLEVDKDATVAQVKDILRKDYSLLPNMTLVFDRRTLDDSEFIRDIVTADGGFILLHQWNSPSARCQPDPVRSTAVEPSAVAVPPDYDIRVEMLVRSGFERAVAKSALCECGYDPGIAGNWLNGKRYASVDDLCEFNKPNTLASDLGRPVKPHRPVKDEERIGRIMSQLNESEKEDLEKLREMNAEIKWDKLIQAFLVCHRDAKLTQEFLGSMKG
jgi:hypothetical protein